MALARGFEFYSPNGSVSTSAFITTQKIKVIGNWTEKQFIQAFRQHVNRALYDNPVAEGEFNSMMPWAYYSNLEEEDLAAIFAYLQSLPAIDHKAVQN